MIAHPLQGTVGEHEIELFAFVRCPLRNLPQNPRALGSLAPRDLNHRCSIIQTGDFRIRPPLLEDTSAVAWPATEIDRALDLTKIYSGSEIAAWPRAFLLKF